ncbi:MAG: asparaginase [Neisseria sp.]|nr:asparaginase [Neisseria sp.]
MNKRIFVLYTGGTIGMVQSEAGLKPDTALVNTALAPFSDGLDFDWHVCTPLIDSSAVQLAHWQEWADMVRSKLPHYDGILILHGTDTLAYTANFFALALPEADKPIVLTGSQWPYNAEGSDAPRNLETAAAALAEDGLKGAWIAFENKLFPAVGSSKVSTETEKGFDNPHFGAAEYRNGVWFGKISNGQTPCSDGLNRRLDSSADVAVYTLIPGKMLRHISEDLQAKRSKAVILQSFGHGNAPADAEFVRAAQSYTENGGLLLNISQVPQGRAAAVYAEGNALRRAGVIQGGKCNLETAAVLLSLAVSNGWTAQEVQQELARLGLTD